MESEIIFCQCNLMKFSITKLIYKLLSLNKDKRSCLITKHKLLMQKFLNPNYYQTSKSCNLTKCLKIQIIWISNQRIWKCYSNNLNLVIYNTFSIITQPAVNRFNHQVLIEVLLHLTVLKRTVIKATLSHIQGKTL